MKPAPVDTQWMADGNCADKSPSQFFPSDGVGVEAARKVCVGCPVISECLEYALSNRIDHGVWGGTSERERRRILKSRAVERRLARAV
ncbi:MAG: WhiB family transcriptional regulator [Microthrixaceae bacterium]